jgi:hypothetical protein
MKFRTLAGLVLLLLIAGCSPVTIQDYQATEPALDLKSFFDGELMAYGMLKNRSGMVTRRFTATIDASWDGENGTLVEHFIFDDGEEQDRVWQLVHQGNGVYTGTAGDVVGEAEGEISGSVFQWQYQLEVPYNDSTIVVKLDDWLYLLDEDRLINQTKLTKFGFRVGELVLFIEKV